MTFLQILLSNSISRLIIIFKFPSIFPKLTFFEWFCLVPGKFFGFGKNIKGQTPVKEREPLKCVILDVGGERFIAQRNSLLKYPTTRLGKLMRASTIQGILTFCDEFVPGDPPEYFFDKNPENFAAILEMHRSGNFHISVNGCALVLQRDLEYWVIDELIMEPCCALKYFPQIEARKTPH